MPWPKRTPKSSKPRAGFSTKSITPEAAVQLLAHQARGYSYQQLSDFLFKQYGVKLSAQSLTKWFKQRLAERHEAVKVQAAEAFAPVITSDIEVLGELRNRAHNIETLAMNAVPPQVRVALMSIDLQAKITTQRLTFAGVGDPNEKPPAADAKTSLMKRLEALERTGK